MKKATLKLVQTGLMLALVIVFELFKNISPFITGPLINCILILSVYFIGIWSGIILSIIAPLFSFFIAPSPITAGIPLIVPVIMTGNCILCLMVWLFTIKKNFRFGFESGMICGSFLKAVFMGCLIILVLLPSFSTNIAVPAEKLSPLLGKAKFMFGAMQLITALIGSFLACIIRIPLSKFLTHSEKN